MSSLWFVVPAHGRHDLTRICLTQLRRTCDTLTDQGLEATAVVIADDANLDTAAELGFGTVRRSNEFLARKFNDGLQLACDPRINPRPADFAVPFGSDDWVDHRIFLQPLSRDAVLTFQQAAFVSEDGQHLSESRMKNPGGVGIRVYPRQLLALCGYRPADEDRHRNCDLSILTNVRAARGDLCIVYGDQHPLQIVDWKSPDEQMNAYIDVVSIHRGRNTRDPFDALEGLYPADALEAMADHYARSNAAETLTGASAAP